MFKQTIMRGELIRLKTILRTTFAIQTSLLS